MSGSAVHGQHRMACIFFPLWPIQRLVVAEPQLRQRRLVLHHQDSRRGQLVYAASPMALQCGISPGMPLTEARSLARSGRQPDLTFRQADPDLDHQQLRELAVTLHQFSPLIGLEQTDIPSALLLSFKGLSRLFHGESGWIEAVQKWLKAHGYHARIALANSIGAAIALARFSDITSAPQFGNQVFDSLPVSALRIEPTTCDTLLALGISAIGQLRLLPRASLASRFGSQLAKRLDQLDGTAAETICSVKPPDNFSASMPLEYPVTDRQVLCELVQCLVSRTASMLALRGQGALRWEIVLTRLEAPHISIEVCLFSPNIEEAHLRQLIEMHLDQVRIGDAEKYPITSISVKAAEYVRVADRQLELFESEDDTVESACVSMLVNRLAVRLGAAQVVRPRVLADPQPERSVKFLPLTGTRVPKRSQRRTSPTAIPRSLERPLRLLNRHVAIHVELDVAEKPCAAGISGERHCIALAVGPERIESGWWRAPIVRRDYWRVETSDARRLWIFRDLKSGKWFLHGVF